MLARLRLRWSPEEIVARLAEEYPTDKTMRISPEAIYQYIYVLPRGSLKQELINALRQERKYRRRKGRSQSDHEEARGKIAAMLSIEERPAEVAERAIPGHWEGDLILGKYKRTALGTLVERTTRTTWNYGPYVIEEFVASTPNDQNSPSLEIFIDEKETKITYVCNQIVDSSGRFMGILMGKDCLERNLQSRLCEIGQTIGNKYSNLGYRGFLDIDFIVSEKGIPYPIETNVRRTGGTHVFDLSKYIFGKDWFKKIVALSLDSFKYPGIILSAEAILNKINEITFPIKTEKKGVVITAVSRHEPVFAFVIFASTKKEVTQIHRKLTKIWD